MSISRWMNAPSRLPGSLTLSFNSSVYFCQLFLVFSASVRFLQFLSFIMPIHSRNIPLISTIILKRSLVFPSYCFPLSLFNVHLRGPSYLSLLFSRSFHSVGYIFPFIPCLSHLSFPQLFVKSPQTTTLSSCISFSLGWFWPLYPIQCYEPLSLVLQALCLLDLISWIYSSPLLYYHKVSYLGNICMT